jgi:glycosyltransferase involved in cell wall biosynthesis
LSSAIDGKETLPRISAIIPVYNGRRFLREAVDSVLNQVLLPIELIIIDDGSNDDSLSVLDDLDPSIPIIKVRQENSGQSAARNHGVRLAKGDYIALLDQDDIWYPEHLEELVKPFAKIKKLGWVYSNVDEIDEEGFMVRIGMLNDIPAQHPKRSLTEMLCHDIYILPSASLIDREAFLRVSGFDERLSGYEDDDLFLRMFRTGYRHEYLNNSLSKWRIYNSSSSFTSRMAQSRRLYAKKLMDMFPDNPTTGRYWVRDCIAPRFFGDARIFYFRGLENRVDAVCEECILDMEECAKYMSVGRKMRLKMRLMRHVKLYRSIHDSKRHLPHALRNLF